MQSFFLEIYGHIQHFCHHEIFLNLRQGPFLLSLASFKSDVMRMMKLTVVLEAEEAFEYGIAFLVVQLLKGLGDSLRET